MKALYFPLNFSLTLIRSKTFSAHVKGYMCHLRWMLDLLNEMREFNNVTPCVIERKSYPETFLAKPSVRCDLKVGQMLTF